MLNADNVSAFLYVSELLGKSSKMEDVERVCKPLTAYKIHASSKHVLRLSAMTQRGGGTGGRHK